MKTIQVFACVLAVLLLLSACAVSAPQNAQPAEYQGTTQARNIQDVMRQTYFEMDKEEFDAFYEKHGEKFSYENIGLEYIGRYGDCHVAFFTSPLAVYSQVVTTEEIGGFQFVYGDGNTLQVYKDGDIVCLKEAYERTWITDASLEFLYNDYIAKYPGSALKKN